MRLLLVLVVGLVLLASNLFNVTGADAQQVDCDTVVVDQANVFGSGLDSVKAEAQKLVNLGADVRVRTADSLGSFSTIDALEKSLETQCKSWQGVDKGVRKNNLVVILATFKDRKTGIFYGSQWHKALDDKYNNIRTQQLNQGLLRGDNAGGFVDALKEIEKDVNLQLNPPSTSSSSSGGNVTNNVDLSGLWKVLGFSLLAVLVIAGAVGGYVFYSRKSKEQEERKGAQRGAKLAKTSASSKITQLIADLTDLEVLVKSAKSRVSEADSKKLSDAFAAAQNFKDKAAEDFGALSGSGSADPDDPHLSPSQAETIRAAYAKVEATADSGLQALTETKSELSKLQEVIESSTKKVSDLKLAFTNSTEAVNAIKVFGFKVDSSDKLLLEAESEIAKAEEFLAANNYTDAQEFLQSAQKALTAAVSSAQELPEQKTKLGSQIFDLGGRLVSVRTTIANANLVFTEISSGYARECWQSVQGNGSESEKRVTVAEQNLTDATKCISMEVQDWDQASSLLENVTKLLDQADGLITSIIALKGHLEQAKVDAPADITDAEADVAQAEGYAKEHAGEIHSDHQTDLANARELLTNARNELGEAKPNYLKVLDLAQSAHSIADKILSGFRDEVAEAARQKQKAAKVVRDARRAVSTAKEYISDHSEDVSDDSRHSLVIAEQSLYRLDNEVLEPTAISALAKSTKESADQAYANAQMEFESAQTERRRRQQTYRSPSYDRYNNDDNYRGSGGLGAIPIPIPIPFGIGGGNDDDDRHDSGGSGSWGGGDSGGGGSGDWGGEDSGGGSSGDWGSSDSGGGGGGDW